MIYAADLFAGAGGTSTGLVNACFSLGLDVDLLAVNHWDLAISTHERNHPWARHMNEDVDLVNPLTAVPGGKLDLMVASPECTHHSKARGGKPVDDQSRSSAWTVLRWANSLYIENILIENVPDFMTWGPLDENKKPVQRLKGQTYLAFLDGLRSLGYEVDARVINCANYGDPTTRERLFIMARRGKPVVWPEPTHSKTGDFGFLAKQRKWVSAKSIIDWSIKGESIFTRKKPLKDTTMRRIMKGLEKFSGLPFFISYYGQSNVQSIESPLPTITAKGEHIGLIEPFVIPLNHGDDQRVYSINSPMPTITQFDAWGVIEPFFIQYHGTSYPGGERVRSINEPFPTVATENQLALVQPFLINYNGTGIAHSIDEPIPTVTGNDRFGLVLPMKNGQQAQLDILFRMLQPHELAAAMSFPKEYQFVGNRREKVKQIGNAVPGRTAEALIKCLLGG